MRKHSKEGPSLLLSIANAIHDAATLGAFFSNEFDNTLMVEVLGNYAPERSLRELTDFNVGYAFLFFFDERGEIAKVYEKVIYYG